MKILIAGFGSIGRRHFHNLLTLGESDILFYRTRAVKNTASSLLPEDELAGYQVETDLSAALAVHPQAVIISNPTALHLEVAIPAAEAGCHLLLEKPISHSLERVDELEAALRRGGGKALVGYQFRFHPGLQKVAELLAQGVIGRPLSVRAHWGEYLPGWHPWEDYRQGYSARVDLGGGVILTLSHPIDYLRWLGQACVPALGEVGAVWAFAGHLSDLDVEVEDTAEIGLQFDNGVIGSLHLDYNQQPSAHYLEIIGTLGTLHWNNGNISLPVKNTGSQATPSVVWNTAEAGWQNWSLPESYERNSMFMAEMRHFLDMINLGTPSLCSLQDGKMSLRLALAALQSAEQGRLIKC
jgi:predicted dehydrogenase